MYGYSPVSLSWLLPLDSNASLLANARLSGYSCGMAIKRLPTGCTSMTTERRIRTLPGETFNEDTYDPPSL